MIRATRKVLSLVDWVAENTDLTAEDNHNLQADLFQIAADITEKDAEIARLREALEFYAKGKHIIHHKPTCFVDGELVGNGWYSYENGQVAKKALEGKP